MAGRSKMKLEERHGEVGKVCSKCSEWKALASYYKQKRNLGGVMAECKKCFSSRLSKNYREDTEKFRIKNSIYYKKNSDSLRAIYAKRYDENKEKINKRNIKWHMDNPNSAKLARMRRTARKQSLPDTFTEEQLHVIIKHFNNGCALTGESENIHWDHAIPLSVGHGGTTKENMYPICGYLNNSKFTSNIFVWFETNRQRFELDQGKFDKLIEWLASANAMTVQEYRDYVYYCHDNPRKLDEDEVV